MAHAIANVAIPILLATYFIWVAERHHRNRKNNL
jgi:hypothetical protein